MAGTARHPRDSAWRHAYCGCVPLASARLDNTPARCENRRDLLQSRQNGGKHDALGQDDVVFLESMDTPTMCNVIEIVAPERRGHGYTTRHLHCAFPDLPPKVGFREDRDMRAKDPIPLGGVGYMQKRLDYLDCTSPQKRHSRRDRRDPEITIQLMGLEAT